MDNTLEPRATVPMKIVVGIDNHLAYKPALQLLSRFRFENTETTLLHCVSPIPAFFPADIPEAPVIGTEYMRAMEETGELALDAAVDQACRHGLRAEKQLRFSGATEGLIDCALETAADLVAVRTEHCAEHSNPLIGSVGKGLVLNCPSSVLVAKQSTTTTGPLRVVLATDHSPESCRWIAKFLSWHAKGIEMIHVVTAYELDDRTAKILSANLPALGGMVDEWVENHLQSLNSNIEAKLKASGYSRTSRVAAGNPNEVIRKAMEDTHADVLLVGAHGHGFVERLLVGSCSLHQVIAETYPVLVVRP